MPRVFIIPHHQDERLFSGTVALANSSQSDFIFHALPPDSYAEGPLSRRTADFREILSYLDQRKKFLGAQQDDLVVAFYDGLLQALEAGLTNLFVAGARHDEPMPCTAVVSLKFLSWELLEDKFNYDLQRHALLHLLICCILGAYTDAKAHHEAYGCLLDFDGRLADFNRKLARGYYLCSSHEKGCLGRVQGSRYGNSIIQLCSALKYKLDAAAVKISIEELVMEKHENYSGQGIIGRHVHAHDNTFNQTWNAGQGEIDLGKLADELAKLRGALKMQAITPEHDTAVGAIAAAECAAKVGDGAGALGQLRNAGKWALDTAKEIGVEVAATAITKALGLGI